MKDYEIDYKLEAQIIRRYEAWENHQYQIEVEEEKTNEIQKLVEPLSNICIRTSNGFVISPNNSKNEINPNTYKVGSNVTPTACGSNDHQDQNQQNKKTERKSDSLKNNSTDSTNTSSTGISGAPVEINSNICPYCQTFSKSKQFCTTPFGLVCNPCGLHWKRCVIRLKTQLRARQFFDWKIRNKMQLNRRMNLVDEFERFFL